MHPIIITIISILSRIIPHPPNFTAIHSIATTHKQSPLVALLITITTVAISDIFLGYTTSPLIYAAHATTCLIAHYTTSINTPVFAFYTLSNAITFSTTTMYPHTPYGAIHCYLNALPFLPASIISTHLFHHIFSMTGYLINTHPQKFTHKKIPA